LTTYAKRDELASVERAGMDTILADLREAYGAAKACTSHDCKSDDTSRSLLRLVKQSLDFLLTRCDRDPLVRTPSYSSSLGCNAGGTNRCVMPFHLPLPFGFRNTRK